ncbi:MAG: phosphoadenosine phosphosulfate reductase family protein [Zestosphaera sp.]
MSSHLVNVFSLLDEVLSSSRRVVIAYSGGKDSTAVALLLREWIELRGRSDVSVLLLNSDTLSEIPEMRLWTKSFMEGYVSRLKALGVGASFRIVTPKPSETFYWRVFVRGYPAPTFSFRWCVYLLKRKPALEVVSDPDSMVLMGHRDEESSARTQSLNSKTMGSFCPLSAGRCSSYYLSREGSAVKTYPIREWRETDVWTYLKYRRDCGEKYLNELFRLYGLYGTDKVGLVKARYGCWHCTLVKHQLGNLVLGEGNLYLEAFRLMYRWVSDMPEARVRKNTGYSKLGYLTAPARSFLLHALKTAEELSQTRLYGLDESVIQEHTLRQIFYELPEDEADKIVTEEERLNNGNRQRVYSMRDLRNLKTYKKEVNAMIKQIKKKAESQPLIKKHISEILSSING